MAATPSTMLPLGTALPSFALTDAVSGKPVASAELKGPRGVLVMFICNHCPYVIHIRSELVKLANHAVEQGFAVVAINSNSEKTHPQDGPPHMKNLAQAEQWRFPFVFDATQDVARAFKAACTPDLFLFDAGRKLAYRGQFDDSRPSNGKPVTGADLRAAIEQVARGEQPPEDQKASIGCNIKWHPS
ncbi:MAG: thioredoxin family protein [Archangiaceae bacterium]|nr:thioredoxin family protein [Archangiaceae bacterium]